VFVRRFGLLEVAGAATEHSATQRTNGSCDTERFLLIRASQQFGRSDRFGSKHKRQFPCRDKQSMTHGLEIATSAACPAFFLGGEERLFRFLQVQRQGVQEGGVFPGGLHGTAQIG
jgi:hypothetical protein